MSYGIVRNWRLEQEADIQPVAELIEELGREGFKSDHWWVGIKSMEYALWRNEFLIQYVEDKDELVDTLVQVLWSLFEARYEQMEAANVALGQVHR